MAKKFEDYFAELQTDMVEICLEYIEERAEKIFIYCSCESGVIAGAFFFQINGGIWNKHKVNDALKPGETPYDVLEERQDAAITIVNDDIAKIKKLCAENGREMPTQMKIVYDVTRNNFNADYRYDLVYTNHPYKTDYTIFEEWVQEETNKLKNNMSQNSRRNIDEHN